MDIERRQEQEQGFGQEPGSSSEQQFDAGIPRPRPVRDFKMLPNGRLIFEGESRGRSEPVRGTGKIRRANNQHNRRR